MYDKLVAVMLWLKRSFWTIFASVAILMTIIWSHQSAIASYLFTTLYIFIVMIAQGVRESFTWGYIQKDVYPSYTKWIRYNDETGKRLDYHSWRVIELLAALFGFMCFAGAPVWYLPLLAGYIGLFFYMLVYNSIYYQNARHDRTGDTWYIYGVEIPYRSMGVYYIITMFVFFIWLGLGPW